MSLPSSDAIVSGVFFAVVAAVVAVLVRAGVTDSTTPAAFETRPLPVVALGDSYQLPVVVENVGGATATKVSVAAQAKVGGEQFTGTATVDFLTAGEQVTTAFVFPVDPREGDVSVAVRSYVRP